MKVVCCAENDSIHKSVKAKFFSTSYNSDNFHFYWVFLNIISMKICNVDLLYIVHDDLHYILEIEQRELHKTWIH